MTTLQFAVASLNQATDDDGPIPLHVTFEEHPASDEKKLRTTLDHHHDWFKRNDITRTITMRSFYEPLFQPESIDFLMSYICKEGILSTFVALVVRKRTRAQWGA